MKGKPTIVKLEDKFGSDLLVKTYILDTKYRNIHHAIYYTDTFIDKNTLIQNNTFILLPFNNKDEWNGDKLIFNKFDQLKKFCETLNISFSKKSI